MEGEAWPLPVDGDAVLLGGNDVAEAIAVGIDHVQLRKTVAHLDSIAALGSAAHLHVDLQLGGFLVPVTVAPEDGERAERGHQQVVARAAGAERHRSARETTLRSRPAG